MGFAKKDTKILDPQNSTQEQLTKLLFPCPMCEFFLGVFQICLSC